MFEKRGENRWGWGTRPGCWTESGPIAGRFAPHPIQLKLRLSSGFSFYQEQRDGERRIPEVVCCAGDERTAGFDRCQQGVILWARGATYIQSPNLKLAFGFGGLLDSANGPDSWGMGGNRS